MSDIHIIGERIQRRREGLNYTREGLAEKAGISSKFLYEIEKGKKSFSIDTLCKISQALAVSCDYIVLGVDEEHCMNNRIIYDLNTMPPEQIQMMQNMLRLFQEAGNESLDF